MLELLSLFLAPLLVNVLSELFKLWIKRRSTLLEGSKNPIGGTVGLFSYIC